MTIDTKSVINSLCAKILSNSWIKSASTNPIYTAFLCIIIIMAIIAFVFRNAETDAGLTTSVMRVGFWGFFATIIIVFLHDKILLEEKTAGSEQTEADKLFTQMPLMPGDAIPVMPVGGNGMPMLVYPMNGMGRSEPTYGVPAYGRESIPRLFSGQ